MKTEYEEKIKIILTTPKYTDEMGKDLEKPTPFNSIARNKTTAELASELSTLIQESNEKAVRGFIDYLYNNSSSAVEIPTGYFAKLAEQYLSTKSDSKKEENPSA